MSASIQRQPSSSPTTMTLTYTLTKAAAAYHVSASGPCGSASSEVSASIAAEIHSAPPTQAGSRLFEALSSGGIGACLQAHRLQARQAGNLLRLCFRIARDAEMRALPFESLCDAASAERLALATEVTIVRDEIDVPDARALEFSAPLRVLMAIAEPNDAPAFGGAQIAAAFAASLAQGSNVQMTRVDAASERAIEAALRAGPWHVIHFVGNGNSRAAARYGTLNLLGSDGRTRAINGQNFAKMCAKHSSLNLVVLQSVQSRPVAHDFDIVTQELRNAGMPAVVWLPHLGAVEASAAFVRELYGSLAAGERLDVAMTQARRALASGGSMPAHLDPGYWRMPVLFAAEKSLARVAEAAHAPVSAPPRAIEPHASHAFAVADEELRTRELKIALRRKRDAGQFDTFMCHNVADKPVVKEIGLRLRDQGLLPWLDEWELRPGMPWQRLLEEQIGSIRSAVVFVGRDGIGPWQRQELDGFLREFAQRHCPVIPVMLPGAPLEPRLPRFLEGMTWVDFRVSAPDPMARLVWGITGHAPEIE